uniref:HECT-type E3 ubiquitin transferase n=1 Tax=Neospora caninum (strain Liverpool) TaxID=572307 RepID=A0A0F7U6R8_NEOCL|nr:TPA: Novel protein (Zgc:63649), related [Neospora caninum Liverpool]
MQRFIVMGRGTGRAASDDSRWAAMLEALQQPNPTQHTACLADLQEWLSYATEGSIGQFPLEAFVSALFDLLDGKPAASAFPRPSLARRVSAGASPPSPAQSGPHAASPRSRRGGKARERSRDKDDESKAEGRDEGDKPRRRRGRSSQRPSEDPTPTEGSEQSSEASAAPKAPPSQASPRPAEGAEDSEEGRGDADEHAAPASAAASGARAGDEGETESGEAEQRTQSRPAGNLAFEFGSLAVRFGLEAGRVEGLLGADDDFVLGAMGDEDLLLLQQQAALLGEDADGQVQKLLLVANCLFLLLDLLPVQAAAAIVRQPQYLRILNSKLTSIEYIDLAEKILQCMDKLSEEQPLSIFLSGGLQACLAFLDFFSLDVQRRTMKSAARLFKTAQAWASTASLSTSVRSVSQGLPPGRTEGTAPAEAAAGSSLPSARSEGPAQRRAVWRRREKDGRADEGGSADSVARYLEKRLEQQREELKRLISPVLPTLSSLLTYEDETLVQYACQCWRSFIDSLVSLHLRAASCSPPCPSVGASPLVSSRSSPASDTAAEASAAREPSGPSVDSATALQLLCRRFGPHGVAGDGALSASFSSSGLPFFASPSPVFARDERDERLRWIEDAGRRYQTSLASLAKELSEVAASSLVPNLLALISRHVDSAVVAARAASPNKDEEKEEGIASLQNACVTDAAHTLAVLANFSTNLAEQVLRDARWKSVDRVMHAVGEGPDFMLLLRFVCLGVSLLPSVVFNLPLFFESLRVDTACSASPKKKKKRPASSFAFVKAGEDAGGNPDVAVGVDVAAGMGPASREASDRKSARAASAPRKVARVLLPDAERSRLFVQEPELFGSLLRTFAGALLRLYDRALSSELLLETLQFLLGSVLTASVASDGDARSFAFSAKDEKDGEKLAGSEAPTREQRSLKDELLAELDSVQVAEFLAYILQTKPSATAVAAALSVTLELLTLAPHVFLPVFFKEGVIAFVRRDLEVAVEAGALVALPSGSALTAAVLPPSPLSRSARQLCTPSAALREARGDLRQTAPGACRGQADSEEREGEETDASGLPLRWCFAFSSSGHVATNLSRLALWMRASILLLPSVQASCMLPASGPVRPTGAARGVDRRVGDDPGSLENAPELEQPTLPPLSASTCDSVLPRLHRVTALLAACETEETGEAVDQAKAGSAPRAAQDGAASPGAAEASVEVHAAEGKPEGGERERAWHAFVALRDLLEGEEQVSAFEFIVSDVAAALAQFLGGLEASSQARADDQTDFEQQERHAAAGAERRTLTPAANDEKSEMETETEGFRKRLRSHQNIEPKGSRADVLHDRLCLFLRAFAFSSALAPQAPAGASLWEDLDWSQADGCLLLLLASLCMKSLGRANSSLAVQTVFSSSDKNSIGTSSCLPPHLRPSTPPGFFSDRSGVRASKLSPSSRALPLTASVPTGRNEGEATADPSSAAGHSSAHQTPKHRPEGDHACAPSSGTSLSATSTHSLSASSSASVVSSSLASGVSGASSSRSSSSSSRGFLPHGDQPGGESDSLFRRVRLYYGLPTAYASLLASRHSPQIPAENEGRAAAPGDDAQGDSTAKGRPRRTLARSLGFGASESAGAAFQETTEDIVSLFSSLHREVFLHLRPSAQERKKARLRAQRLRSLAPAAGKPAGDKVEEDKVEGDKTAGETGDPFAAEASRPAETEQSLDPDGGSAGEKKKRGEKKEGAPWDGEGLATKRRREQGEAEAGAEAPDRAVTAVEAHADRGPGENESEGRGDTEDKSSEAKRNARRTCDAGSPSRRASSRDEGTERKGHRRARERRRRGGSQAHASRGAEGRSSSESALLSSLIRQILPSSLGVSPGEGHTSAGSPTDLLSLLVRSAALQGDDDISDEDDFLFSQAARESRGASQAFDSRSGFTASLLASGSGSSLAPVSHSGSATASSQSAASPSTASPASSASGASSSSSFVSSHEQSLLQMIDRLNASLGQGASASAVGGDAEGRTRVGVFPSSLFSPFASSAFQRYASNGGLRGASRRHLLEGGERERRDGREARAEFNYLLDGQASIGCIEAYAAREVNYTAVSAYSQRAHLHASPQPRSSLGPFVGSEASARSPKGDGGDSGEQAQGGNREKEAAGDQVAAAKKDERVDKAELQKEEEGEDGQGADERTGERRSGEGSSRPRRTLSRGASGRGGAEKKEGAEEAEEEKATPVGRRRERQTARPEDAGREEGRRRRERQKEGSGVRGTMSCRAGRGPSRSRGREGKAVPQTMRRSAGAKTEETKEAKPPEDGVERRRDSSHSPHAANEDTVSPTQRRSEVSRRLESSVAGERNAKDEDAEEEMADSVCGVLEDEDDSEEDDLPHLVRRRERDRRSLRARRGREDEETGALFSLERPEDTSSGFGSTDDEDLETTELEVAFPDASSLACDRSTSRLLSADAASLFPSSSPAVSRPAARDGAEPSRRSSGSDAPAASPLSSSSGSAGLSSRLAWRFGSRPRALFSAGKNAPLSSSLAFAPGAPAAKKNALQLFVGGIPVPPHMTLTEALCRYNRCFPSTHAVRLPRSTAVPRGLAQCAEQRHAEGRGEAGKRTETRAVEGRLDASQSLPLATVAPLAAGAGAEGTHQRNGEGREPEGRTQAQFAAPPSCVQFGDGSVSRTAREALLREGGNESEKQERHPSAYAVLDLNARFLVAADADLPTLPCHPGSPGNCPRPSVHPGQSSGVESQRGDREETGETEETAEEYTALWDARHAIEYEVLAAHDESDRSDSTPFETVSGGEGNDGNLDAVPSSRPSSSGCSSSGSSSCTPCSSLPGAPASGPAAADGGETASGDAAFLREQEQREKDLLEGRQSPLLCTVVDSVFGSRRLLADFRSFVQTRAAGSRATPSPRHSARPPTPLAPLAVPASSMEVCVTPERRRRDHEASAAGKGPPPFASKILECSLISAFEDAVACMAFLRGSAAAPPRRDLLLCAGAQEAAELVCSRKSLRQDRRSCADAALQAPLSSRSGEPAGSATPLFGDAALSDIFARDRTSASLVFLLTLLHHLVKALRRGHVETAFVCGHACVPAAHGSLTSSAFASLARRPPLSVDDGAGRDGSLSVESSKRTRRWGDVADAHSSGSAFRFKQSAPSILSLSEAQLSRFFTSSALSLKLLQVLSDPALVFSLCPPLWLSRLLRGCSFLFPFSARMLYLCQASLGLNRSLCCFGERVREAIDHVAARGGASGVSLASSLFPQRSGNSASSSRFAPLALAAAPLGNRGSTGSGVHGGGTDPTSRALMVTLVARVFSQIKSSPRQQQEFVADLETAVALPRTKVKIHRTRILDSAFKVMEHFHSLLYSSSGRGGVGGNVASQQQPLLEVEYFGEEGVGSGPTIEFYSEVLEALQTHTVPRLFREASSDGCFFPFPYTFVTARLSPSLLRKPECSPLTSSGSSGSMLPSRSSSSPVRAAAASPASSSSSPCSSASAASLSSSSVSSSSVSSSSVSSSSVSSFCASSSTPVAPKAPEEGGRTTPGPTSESRGEGEGEQSAGEAAASSRGEGEARERVATDSRRERKTQEAQVPNSCRLSLLSPRNTPLASSPRSSPPSPAPPSSSSLVSAAPTNEDKVFLLFKLLGQIAAKALLDGRSFTVDLRLHPAFWRLVVEREVCTCGALPLAFSGSLEARDGERAEQQGRGRREDANETTRVRRTRAQTKREKEREARREERRKDEKLEEHAQQRQPRRLCRACVKAESLGLTDLNDVDEQLARSMQHLLRFRSEGNEVEDLALVFVLPGTDIELVEGGSEIAVCNENLDLYIHRVIQVVLLEGVLLQAYAFRYGISTFIPLSSLALFSPQERAYVVFGGGGRIGDSRFWNMEHLRAHIVPDHGFTASSATYIAFLEVLTEFSVEERRRFLRFATGTPVLPHGGFASLRPLMKVVRKPQENGGEGATCDDVLPSVMTCTNYIKLPEYSSKQILRLRLSVAMTEGQGAFTLS